MTTTISPFLSFVRAWTPQNLSIEEIENPECQDLEPVNFFLPDEASVRSKPVSKSSLPCEIWQNIFRFIDMKMLLPLRSVSQVFENNINYTFQTKILRSVTDFAQRFSLLVTLPQKELASFRDILRMAWMFQHQFIMQLDFGRNKSFAYPKQNDRESFFSIDALKFMHSLEDPRAFFMGLSYLNSKPSLSVNSQAKEVMLSMNGIIAIIKDSKKSEKRKLKEIIMLFKHIKHPTYNFQAVCQITKEIQRQLKDVDVLTVYQDISKISKYSRQQETCQTAWEPAYKPLIDVQERARSHIREILLANHEIESALEVAKDIPDVDCQTLAYMDILLVQAKRDPKAALSTLALLKLDCISNSCVHYLLDEINVFKVSGGPENKKLAIEFYKITINARFNSGRSQESYLNARLSTILEAIAKDHPQNLESIVEQIGTFSLPQQGIVYEICRRYAAPELWTRLNFLILFTHFSRQNQVKLSGKESG